jgi:arylsulfatase A-like enzyme
MIIGYQAISAYGSRVNKTPNIDRLAKEGMRFDRCFVTNSICGPSRAVIQPGKHLLQSENVGGWARRQRGQVQD